MRLQNRAESFREFRFVSLGDLRQILSGRAFSSSNGGFYMLDLIRNALQNKGKIKILEKSDSFLKKTLADLGH